MKKIKEIRELKPKIKEVKEIDNVKDKTNLGSRNREGGSNEAIFEEPEERTSNIPLAERRRNAALENIEEETPSPNGQRNRREEPRGFYESVQTQERRAEYTTTAQNVEPQQNVNRILRPQQNRFLEQDRQINEINPGNFREQITTPEKKYEHKDKSEDSFHVKRRRDLF